MTESTARLLFINGGVGRRYYTMQVDEEGRKGRTILVIKTPSKARVVERREASLYFSRPQI